MEVISNVAWSNTCELVNITLHLNDSLTMTTPLPPSDTVEYQWTCTRSDSADCFTPFGQMLSMYGTVELSPVGTFLDGLGHYEMIGNVTDPYTGGWSCRMYSIGLVDWTVTTTESTTASDSTEDPQGGESTGTGGDGTTPDGGQGSDQTTTTSERETTTLGENVVSFIGKKQ